MTFTKAQKDLIAQKVEDYLKANKEISQAQFANLVGVSAPIISFVTRRMFDHTNTGGSVILSDNVLRKIDAFFQSGIMVWEIKNYQDCFTAMMEAKKFRQQRIIDGPKGCGKSFTAEDFLRQVPNETYVVTCTTDMTPKGFIVAVAKAMGLSTEADRYTLRLRIGDKLLNEKHPVLIIDEAENLKDAAFGSLKDLYDYKMLYRHVGMVIIGANNFVETLNRRAARLNSKCYPQFVSRFGLNPIYLQNKEHKDTRKVCEYYGITDRDLIAEFHQRSSDFRQLDKLIKDYLKDLTLANNGQNNNDKAA